MPSGRGVTAADGVNFLAAGVLYALAASNVRGFAFTLGVTTLIDLAVVILFTHPVVGLLAHTKFFGGGHRLSGLDPERLARSELERHAVDSVHDAVTGEELRFEVLDLEQLRHVHSLSPCPPRADARRGVYASLGNSG